MNCTDTSLASEEESDWKELLSLKDRQAQILAVAAMKAFKARNVHFDERFQQKLEDLIMENLR